MVRKLLNSAARKKKLEKEIDVLWSKIARKLWGNKCGWPGCDKTDSLSAHHFFGKKAHGLISRYELDNSILLCFYHHIGRVHQQGDTEPARDALVQRIGQKAFDDLKGKIVRVWKPAIEDLEELKQDFQIFLDSEF